MWVSRRLLSGENTNHCSPVAFRLVPVFLQDVVAYTCSNTTCLVNWPVYGRCHGRAATSFASSKARGGLHTARSARALAQGES